MQLKIKKLEQGAVLPNYATAGDAGMDLFALESARIEPGARTQIRTGIAMEIPDGFVGLVWDKSGLSHKYGLKTLGGVIDSGYRGEILVGVVNLCTNPIVFEAGQKVAQMLIQKVEQAEIVEVDDLSSTDRGEGGFGSTGK